MSGAPSRRFGCILAGPVSSVRLLFAALLAAAPLAPLALDTSGAAGAACCPLGGSMECCSAASCSISRCRSPEPAAVPALPPVVLVASCRLEEPGDRSLPSSAEALALDSGALDLPDPPPRD
jgi:hypothetical protein